MDDSAILNFMAAPKRKRLFPLCSAAYDCSPPAIVPVPVAFVFFLNAYVM